MGGGTSTNDAARGTAGRDLVEHGCFQRHKLERDTPVRCATSSALSPLSLQRATICSRSDGRKCRRRLDRATTNAFVPFIPTLYTGAASLPMLSPGCRLRLTILAVAVLACLPSLFRLRKINPAECLRSL